MDFHERLPFDKGEIQRILMEGHQATVWTALPCIISSFNPGAVTVECVPSIQGSFTKPDGTVYNVTMPTLVDVPVCFPRGGGYTMTFPIVPGDECLVVFSSRCIDGWWQSGDTAPPTEHRMHDLSDGFAIVGPFSQKTKISNISTTTAQFRSDDGKLFVDLDHAGGIATVTAPTQIIMNAPIIVMNAATHVEMNTPLTEIDGIIQVLNTSGVATASTVNGTLRATGDVFAATIGLQEHHHSASGGTGNSGPPIP